MLCCSKLKVYSKLLQAGLFFLKHAEAVEKDLPPRELHELLLLSLQWLSGMISLSNPYETYLRIISCFNLVIALLTVLLHFSASVHCNFCVKLKPKCGS